MDFLLILKYVSIAFSSAIIVMASYHLTRNIALSALGSDAVYNSVFMLIFGIVGSSFVAACWLSTVASWDWVVILFIVIVIPALLGLWSAVDKTKRKLKEAEMEKVRLEFEDGIKEKKEPDLPSYMKRLNSKFSNDKVGQTFITTIKIKPPGQLPKDVKNDSSEKEQ